MSCESWLWAYRDWMREIFVAMAAGAEKRDRVGPWASTEKGSVGPAYLNTEH